MAHILENNTDISQICRICLKKFNELMNLNNSTNPSLIEMLMEVAAIQHLNLDGLPNSVCKFCAKQLSDAFYFKQEIKNSESILVRFLIQRKNESVDSSSTENNLVTDTTYFEYDEDIKEENVCESYQIESSGKSVFVMCQYCGEKYFQLDELYTHIKLHIDEQSSYKCLKCDKNFDAAKKLWQHSKNHPKDIRTVKLINNETSKPDEIQLYTCNVCKQNLSSSTKYVEHMRTHNRNVNTAGKLKIFACKHCPEKFKYTQSLKSHTFAAHCIKRQKTVCQRRKSKNEIINRDVHPFTCVQCNQEFKTKDCLEKHKIRHINQSPIVSTNCYESFSSENSSHILKHEDYNYKENLEENSNIEKKKKFVCDWCGKVLLTSSRFTEHRRIHTGEKPHQCPHCIRAFTSKSNLMRHIMIHTGEKPFSCRICDRKFSRVSSLKLHSLRHSDSKPFPCSKCEREFTEMRWLRVHKLKDHPESDDNANTNVQVHSCETCGKLFPSTSKLLQHNRKHSGEKPFSCSRCSKTFSSKGNLNKHMVIHSDELPFSCNICEKKYHRIDLLQAHIIRHTDTRPYNCVQCNKTFIELRSLMKHEAKFHQIENLEETTIKSRKIHENYPCSFCDKIYRSSRSLEIHHRKHKKIFPYLCTQCGRQFANSESLKYHINSHNTTKRYKCETCNKSYKNEKVLKVHIRLHTDPLNFLCSICGKNLKSHSALRYHLRTHNKQRQRPYCCNICSKTFMWSWHLTAHLKKHSGEKPFGCDVCDKAYFTNSELMKHKATHSNIQTNKKPL